MAKFDYKKCREQGLLAKALIWLGKEDGKSEFKWCVVAVQGPANDEGQYFVTRIRDGWRATTNKVRNLTEEELVGALGFEIA